MAGWVRQVRIWNDQVNIPASVQLREQCVERDVSRIVPGKSRLIANHQHVKRVGKSDGVSTGPFDIPNTVGRADYGTSGAL